MSAAEASLCHMNQPICKDQSPWSALNHEMLIVWWKTGDTDTDFCDNMGLNMTDSIGEKQIKGPKSSGGKEVTCSWVGGEVASSQA